MHKLHLHVNVYYFPVFYFFKITKTVYILQIFIALQIINNRSLKKILAFWLNSFNQNSINNSGTMKIAFINQYIIFLGNDFSEMKGCSVLCITTAQSVQMPLTDQNS